MKRRMTRLTAIVLTCGMIFALGACGNKNESPAEDQATEAQADGQTTEVQADGQAKEAQVDGENTAGAGDSQDSDGAENDQAASEAAGDTASKGAGDPTGMANPWVEYSNMEEACNAAGFSFNVPETVGSYVGLTFSVMNNELIQVVYGEPDKGVAIRKAKGSEDISGDYNTYAEEKEADVNGMTVRMSGNDGLIALAVWEKDGYSYSVTVTDEENPGLSQSTMEEIVQAAW